MIKPDQVKMLAEERHDQNTDIFHDVLKDNFTKSLKRNYSAGWLWHADHDERYLKVLTKEYQKAGWKFEHEPINNGILVKFWPNGAKDQIPTVK